MDADIAETIFELAIGHGLVDDLVGAELTQSDVLDLISRLLLSDAIDVNEAVELINRVIADDRSAPAPKSTQ